MGIKTNIDELYDDYYKFLDSINYENKINQKIIVEDICEIGDEMVKEINKKQKKSVRKKIKTFFVNLFKFFN